jgi:peptidoglycan/LPS O-acetylase OafA/YrhL
MNKPVAEGISVKRPGQVSLASVLVGLQGLLGLIGAVAIYTANASPSRLRGSRGFENLGTGAVLAILASLIVLMVADRLARLRGWAYVAVLGFEGLLFAICLAVLIDQTHWTRTSPELLPVIGLAGMVMSLLANPSSRHAFRLAAKRSRPVRTPEPARYGPSKPPGGRVCGI